MSFNGMKFNTRILIDGNTAHFLSWATLASFKSYINMKEIQMSSDRKIAILLDACWCILNDFLMAAVVAWSLWHKSSNDAACYNW